MDNANYNFESKEIKEYNKLYQTLINSIQFNNKRSESSIFEYLYTLNYGEDKSEEASIKSNLLNTRLFNEEFIFNIDLFISINPESIQTEVYSGGGDKRKRSSSSHSINKRIKRTPEDYYTNKNNEQFLLEKEEDETYF